MSGYHPPSSLSSVEALLERKRAANEVSELELHLLLRAESLEREKEDLRKKLEVSELEIERLVALLDTWVGPSSGHGTGYKLQGYELQVTGYKSTQRVTAWQLRATGYRATGYK